MAVPEAVAGLAAIPGLRTAAQLKQPTAETPAAAGLLPVTPALAELLPGGGLRRGSTVSVSGSTALVLALLAEPRSRARGLRLPACRNWASPRPPSWASTWSGSRWYPILGPKWSRWYPR